MKEFLKRHLRLLWMALSVAIVAGDYLSGPNIHFPILFVFPVALSTWFSGKWWGFSLAMGLPLTRLLFFFDAEFDGSVFILLANCWIRMAVLGVIAAVIDLLVQSRREVEMLQRILPICSFCKKIRREDNSWSAVEAYFTDPGKLVFSHGICPDCLKENYGDLLESKILKPPTGTNLVGAKENDGETHG